LQKQDKVEREAGDEAVENEGVRDFLEGGKDARGGAEEVVNNLKFD
jgi:hypothetical protein